MADQTLPFSEAVRRRHSVRAFLSKPLAQDVIDAVLEEAQRAPSNCNTQPWCVHIVSGARRDELSRALIEASRQGRYSSDFNWSVEYYPGRFRERQMAQGKVYYETLAVAREDVASRADATEANYSFFNAPHVALLFMPSVGNNVRVAADVGMYAQTFLLALAARGLGGVPQTSLGGFADTIRQVWVSRRTSSCCSAYLSAIRIPARQPISWSCRAIRFARASLFMIEVCAG